MRFVIVGAGAIGGLVGARLHEHGHDVALVTRGEHRAIIEARGLRVDAPDGEAVLRLPAFESPDAAALTDDDIVLLATKSQHTGEALDAVAGVAPRGIAVACLQNGVANERATPRRFARVQAVRVMVPSTHLEPGVVRAHRAAPTGILDVGRYPDGVDDLTRALSAAFASSDFASEPRPDIMRWKYTKLLMNLGNAIKVLCGPEARGGELFRAARAARAEGRACLAAARIPYASDEEDAERRGQFVPRSTAGGGRVRGGSSWQSAERRTGNVEADYLNGEIVLLGRLHGLPTPVNATLQRLANDLARRRDVPGRRTEAEVLALAG